MNYQDLWTDIKYTIFFLLPIPDIRSYVCVCKSWNLMTKSRSVQPRSTKPQTNQSQTDQSQSAMQFALDNFYQELIMMDFLGRGIEPIESIKAYFHQNPMTKRTIEFIYYDCLLPKSLFTPINRCIYTRYSNEKIYYNLAKKKCNNVIKSLFGTFGKKFLHDICRGAYCGQNQELIDYLGITNDHIYADHASLGAADAGSLQMIKTLHQQNFPIPLCCLDIAIKSKNLELFKYLRSICIPEHNNNADHNIRYLELAVETNQIEIINMLATYCDAEVLCIAVCNFDLLKMLYSINNAKSDKLVGHAAFIGNTEIIQWAYDNNFPVDENFACEMAVRSNNIELLTTFVQKKYTYTSDLYIHAAANGNIEMIKYLRNQGLLWGNGACQAAARCDKFATLIYLVDNNCPWVNNPIVDNHDWIDYDDTSIVIAITGNMTMLEFIYEKGCPIHIKMSKFAARFGNLNVLKWLFKRNLSSKKGVISEAAKYGFMDIVQWAYSKGYPWDQNVCINALNNGHMEIYRWVKRYGCNHIDAEGRIM